MFYVDPPLGRWPKPICDDVESFTQIEYWLSNTFPNDFQWQNAAGAASGNWNGQGNSRIRLTHKGPSGLYPWVGNGMSELSYGIMPPAYSGAGGVTDCDPDVGTITECDVLFSSQQPFGFNGETDELDFETVANHEFGHVLGFSGEFGTGAGQGSYWDYYESACDNSLNLGSENYRPIMCWNINIGEIRRTLETPDIDWLQRSYCQLKKGGPDGACKTGAVTPNDQVQLRTESAIASQMPQNLFEEYFDLTLLRQPSVQFVQQPDVDAPGLVQLAVHDQ